MINGIVNRFKTTAILNEEMDMLSEMSDTDMAMEEVDSDILSPEERKAIEAELKNIPEDLEAEVKLTSKDLKKAEKQVEPTVQDLAESLMR